MVAFVWACHPLTLILSRNLFPDSTQSEASNALVHKLAHTSFVNIRHLRHIKQCQTEICLPNILPRLCILVLFVQQAATSFGSWRSMSVSVGPNGHHALELINSGLYFYHAVHDVRYLADCDGHVVMLRQVWGNAACLTRLPVAHLAYQTAALEAALQLLQKPGLDACSGWTTSLLQGVSNRLSSPSSAVRCRASQVPLCTLLEPLFEVSMWP